jgi:hypothetical protein
MESRTCSELPPGFRFHPTDEELIVYYLCNQATSQPCPASIIPEVDIYKFDPWELPGIIIYIYIFIKFNCVKKLHTCGELSSDARIIIFLYRRCLPVKQYIII